jgi:subtilisin family serine protease
MPIRVADARGIAQPHVVAAGISWAIRHGADVINLSLATMVPDTEISSTIAAALAQGIVVVASAGDAAADGPEFPASVAGVVAAYGQDHLGKIAPGSNVPVGDAATVPGVDIVTLAEDRGEVRRVMVGGTSMAAAIVSGLMADCLSSASERGSARPDRRDRCKSRILRSPEASGFLKLDHVVEGGGKQ